MCQSAEKILDIWCLYASGGYGTMVGNPRLREAALATGQTMAVPPRWGAYWAAN